MLFLLNSWILNSDFIECSSWWFSFLLLHPGKFNIAPENIPYPKGNSFSNHHFSGATSMWNFGGVTHTNWIGLSRKVLGFPQVPKPAVAPASPVSKISAQVGGDFWGGISSRGWCWGKWSPSFIVWLGQKKGDAILPIYRTRWWFQIFFIFIPTWGDDPIWLIFFKGVETTNQIYRSIFSQVIIFRSPEPQPTSFFVEGNPPCWWFESGIGCTWDEFHHVPPPFGGIWLELFPFASNSRKSESWKSGQPTIYGKNHQVGHGFSLEVENVHHPNSGVSNPID